MERAIRETERRREKQLKYNLENDIVPKGIEREVSDVLEGLHVVRGSKKRKESARKDEKVAGNTFVNTDQLGKESFLEYLLV